MLTLTLQIAILLTAIVLPYRSFKTKKGTKYIVDKDTSLASYAINEDGLLERINSPEKGPHIPS
ncbi:MAG: hypothetical protein V4619_17110 [Bacteroidota bacterium]